MTPNMRRALEYLDTQMEAPSRSIGRELIPIGAGIGGIASIGAATCGHLRRLGYVTFLSDLRAWRITAAGREALKGQ